LETFEEKNLSFYHHRGFQVVVTLRRGWKPARLLLPLVCMRYAEKCGVAATRCAS
jgi:hypothetical protein